jgi:RimJ/RimL family protein N-acetyltransferase
MNGTVGKPVRASHASDGIVLKPLQAEQLPLTLAWRNREGVRQRFLNSDVISPEAHRAWFARYLGKQDDVVLLAYLPGEDVPFGQVAIYDIDRERCEAEVGRFVVSPEHQGRGLMRKALQALVDLSRGHLALRTLRLEVRDDNLRAISLYESLGFAESARRQGLVEMRLDLQG